jgi:hypothetical protein
MCEQAFSLSVPPSLPMLLLSSSIVSLIVLFEDDFGLIDSPHTIGGVYSSDVQTDFGFMLLLLVTLISDS